jgi:hypothetical protein
MENSKIIEIGGVKLEVDLREARTVESYRVGDAVKVLVKEAYGEKYSSFPGIIAGFDNFEKLPSIVVAYVNIQYSEAKIETVVLNKQTEGIELCPINDLEVSLDKSTAIDFFKREIKKKEMEAAEIRAKLAYFLAHFGKHFEGGDTETIAIPGGDTEEPALTDSDGSE